MENKFTGPNSKLSLKVRIAVLVAGFILLVVNLYMIDYESLWSRNNLAAAFNIVANLFIIAGMLGSIQQSRRQRETE